MVEKKISIEFFFLVTYIASTFSNLLRYAEKKGGWYFLSFQIRMGRHTDGKNVYANVIFNEY